MRRPKCSASSGISPCRARSGGKVITSNDRRSSRSARNLPLVDLRRQILVGGGDDADVDADRLGCADARDLAIFGGAEQPVLRRHRQGSELVEEQGPAVGLLEASVTRLGGAGEAPRFMPEKLSLDQVFRQRGAVHDNQRPGPARRKVMKTFGDQLLAGASLPDHQHRTVKGAARLARSTASRNARLCPMNWSVRSMCRLLVANPTNWQGFSAHLRVEIWRISGNSGLSRNMARLLYSYLQV